MKIRKDFVTNSSSSSYICDACGYVAAGWDMCLSEAEMVECENGHTICESEMGDLTFEVKKAYIMRSLEHEIKYNKERIAEDPDRAFYHDRLESSEKELEKLKNLTEEDVDNDSDLEDFIEGLAENCELEYNYPAELCPVCSHSTVTDYELINYACTQLNMTRADLVEAAREYLIAEDKAKNK